MNTAASVAAVAMASSIMSQETEQEVVEEVINPSPAFYWITGVILSANILLSSYIFSLYLAPECNGHYFQPNILFGFAYFLDSTIGVGTGFARYHDEAGWIHIFEVLQTILMMTWFSATIQIIFKHTGQRINDLETHFEMRDRCVSQGTYDILMTILGWLVVALVTFFISGFILWIGGRINFQEAHFREFIFIFYYGFSVGATTGNFFPAKRECTNLLIAGHCLFLLFAFPTFGYFILRVGLKIKNLYVWTFTETQEKFETFFHEGQEPSVSEETLALYRETGQPTEENLSLFTDDELPTITEEDSVTDEL